MKSDSGDFNPQYIQVLEQKIEQMREYQENIETLNDNKFDRMKKTIEYMDR